MRVRYERYKKGQGHGGEVQCDLTEKQARELYKELFHDATCAWAELVAEDDNEGDYMEILESFDHVRQARVFTTLF